MVHFLCSFIGLGDRVLSTRCVVSLEDVGAKDIAIKEVVKIELGIYIWDLGHTEVKDAMAVSFMGSSLRVLAVFLREVL